MIDGDCQCLSAEGEQAMWGMVASDLLALQLRPPLQASSGVRTTHSADNGLRPHPPYGNPGNPT